MTTGGPWQPEGGVSMSIWPCYVTESLDRYCALIAAPIISEGDALGLVVFVGTEGESNAGETEYKLAQAIAGFLGKHMEC